MTFFYLIAISFYTFVIKISAFINKKAKLFHDGRKNWYPNLKKKLDPDSKYIWFHCASLGEFEQGRPVIEYIKKELPDYKIVLTFFSPSGYEIRKNYNAADIVMYLPSDTLYNARKFIDLVRPEKAFFIKYEFWYFFITELKKREIPAYLISGIFRENQIFFSKTPWGRWFRKILFSFSHFFIQDEKSAELLSKSGLTNYSVCGDTRFDRVAEIAANSGEFPVIKKFKDGNPLIVAGSTWQPDEEILTEFINKNDGIKIVFAPHEVESSNIKRLQEMIKKPSVRYSAATSENILKADAMIIDSIGILSSLYKYGTVAYIGGGFGVGIHNILEPATFGLPVIFGPNHKKFREAIDLVNLGGAFPVNNQAELTDKINNLLTCKNKLTESSEITIKYVKQNQGATKFIINKIFNKQF
jgi:3-deoxy-D-manno-octulosonic-acid transferase